MDIEITEVGGFYTFNLLTERAVNYTLHNVNILVHMRISEEMFFMDNREEVISYIYKVLMIGLTVSLNGNNMIVNHDNAVAYSR